MREELILESSLLLPGGEKGGSSVSAFEKWIILLGFRQSCSEWTPQFLPAVFVLKRDLRESIVLWDTGGLQDGDTVNTPGSHGRAWSISDHFQPSRVLVSMLSKETV